MIDSNALVPPVSRRAALSIGIAGVAALWPSPAWSRSAMPEVDSLTLRVLIDNATFGPFLPDADLPGLRVLRRSGDAGSARMSRTALHAEFGLSLLATSQKGGTPSKVLIDFGYTPEAMRNNLMLLGIDVSDLDAAVLSHGHLDHYGGFTGVFATKPLRQVPLFVGGEEAFCERLAMIGVPPPIMGTLDRVALNAAGFGPKIASAPQIINGQAFTSGVIPLSTTERAAIPTQMRPGNGCDRDKLADVKRNSSQLPDDAEHELATCYIVKGLGLVVIASCSHRGVINSVRQAQRISGVEKVHAVIGGFHLVRPRTEDEAKRTVADFAAINPTYIVPMHCSGDVFLTEALRVMPQKIIRSYVGTEFIFAA